MKLNLGKIGNDKEVYTACYVTKSRYGFAHHAKAILPNGKEVSAKVCYCNRTWESFRFQTVLHCLCNEIAREMFGAPSMRSFSNAKCWSNAREYADELKGQIDFQG